MAERDRWFVAAVAVAVLATAALVVLAGTGVGTPAGRDLTRRAEAAAPGVARLVVDALGGHREADGSVSYGRAWTAPTGLDALARHASGSHGRTPDDDRRAAEAGLRRAAPGSECAGMYEVVTTAGTTCTHGDDRHLVGSPPLFGERRGRTAARATCIGDGSSGNRVQLAYVRRSNQADRYAATKAAMQAWATRIDEVMVLTAQKTGGVRRVRWATDSSCVPTVANIVVGTGVGDFGPMVSAMVAAGYDRPDRKYLVASEIGSYCGLGETFPDDQPGAANDNNGGGSRGLVASVAPRCWIDTVAAHELMHTLGAVQDSAPHATDYGHCTDAEELMCYVDGPGTVLQNVCPASHESLYDCGNDDYFHTNPALGAYLKSHWNTANSSFLDASGSTSPPFSPASVTATPGVASARASWEPPAFDGGSAVIGYVVTATPGGRSVSVTAAARTATVTGLADGVSHTLTVAAVNRYGVGTGAVSGRVTPTPVIATLGDFGGEFLMGVAGTSGATTHVATYTTVEAVSPAGTRTLLAGDGFDSTDPPPDGMAATAASIRPVDVAVHPTTGDVWFSDEQTGRIRRITAGKLYSVAGGGTTGLAPGKIAFDPSGNLFVVDTVKPKVWRVSTTGALSVYAGADTAGSSGDGGAATAARFQSPRAVAVDTAGNVYVADEGAHRVRRIVPGGTISTYAGDGTTFLEGDGGAATTTSLPYPNALAWGNGRLYVHTVGMVRAVGTDGTVTTWAGKNVYATAGDGGPAALATFEFVADMAVVAGRVVIGDQTAARLRDIAAPAVAASGAAPSAPPAAVAHAGRESATVAWVPPGNGGSVVTSYTVTVSPGGATVVVPGDQATAVITGLTPGASYSFSVKATNAVGPGPATATNAVVPTARPPYDPFGSWSALVTQQFRDFAGRAPTSAELAAHTAALSGGAKSAAQFVIDMSRSTAFAGVYGPVTRLYFAYFLRVPDLGGLDYWVGKLRNGTKLDVVSQSFASSNEFAQRYGTLSNAAFVEKVYTNVLGRPGEAAGMAFWTQQLDSGKYSRGRVMIGFSESDEYKRVRAAEIDTILLHRGLLARMPTAGEFSTTVARLKAVPATPLTTIVVELLSLPAYAGRVTK